MEKRILISLATISLIVMISPSCQFLSSQPEYNNPLRIEEYNDLGFYTINSATIFEEIDQEPNGAFTPLLVDPIELESEFGSVLWTHSDLLQIANALSLIVWDESLNFDNWDVFHVEYGRGCMDKFNGFNEFRIVYYKQTNKDAWQFNYSARIIEIRSWVGLVSWGEKNGFSASFLNRWEPIDFMNFNINAENALQIAEEEEERKLVRKSTMNVPFRLEALRKTRECGT